MDPVQNELDMAFDKEIFVIQNDLYYQQLDVTRNGRKELLRVDISYKPYSTLSGDTYSLRRTKNGKIVGFIADAMGKGISASMSAMALTRFLNFFFDEYEEEEGGFVFEKWGKMALKYLQKNLFNDEMMSVTFFEYDIEKPEILYASCGMPVILVMKEDGEVEAIRSNNPPLYQFSDVLRIDRLPLASIKKMLFYTDGLSESPTADGELYAKKLKEDFASSSCVKEFRDKVTEQIGKGEDDLTYFYIQRVDSSLAFRTLTIESTQEAIDEALHEMADFLRENKVDTKTLSQILLTCSELALNALEHGNFGIDSREKSYLIENNMFDEEIMRLEKIHYAKPIVIEYGMLTNGVRKRFEATITDVGDGFDTRILKNLVINPDRFNGRGFVIIRKLVDHFYFNTKGSAITIQKFIPSEL